MHCMRREWLTLQQLWKYEKAKWQKSDIAKKPFNIPLLTYFHDVTVQVHPRFFPRFRCIIYSTDLKRGYFNKKKCLCLSYLGYREIMQTRNPFLSLEITEG